MTRSRSSSRSRIHVRSDSSSASEPSTSDTQTWGPWGRRLPELYLSTSQVGETTHMISLKKEDGAVIFEKEFANDGSDITLGQILPVAECNLVANNHITYQGQVVVIFEGLVITTKLSTVVVKKFCRKEPNKMRKTCCWRRVA